MELAFILPVLILLLMGIMEGGRIFSSYVELENVAREGARYASLNCTSMTIRDDEVPGWVSSTLVPWLGTRLSMLDSATLSVNFARRTGADGTEMWVEVSVSYPLQIETPVIRDLTGNPVNLQTKIVMRSE